MKRGRFDHHLFRSAPVALFVFFMISQLSVADQLLPITEFTVRHQNGFVEIDSDPFGFFGFVQEGSSLVDESFVEFDLTSLSSVYDTKLELVVFDDQVALTFDVSTYYGTGSPSVLPFGTGDFLTTLSLDLQRGERTYTLDLTSQVAAAISDGQAFLGIRLHDPAGIPPGSDRVPFVEYRSAKLLYSVPEPSTFVLVGVGVAGLLAYAWRKHPGLQVKAP